MFQAFKSSHPHDEDAHHSHDAHHDDPHHEHSHDDSDGEHGSDHGEYPSHQSAQIALDIIETLSAVYIFAPIAGVALEEIDITLSDNVLTISGERREPEVDDSIEKHLLSECFFGLFSRSVILPENLDFLKIEASMAHNLLEIKIPKIVIPSKTIPIFKKG